VTFTTPLRLRSLAGGDAGRKVTWLELFFDLIFVAAVSQVAEPLREQYSVVGLVRFTPLFVLIWWAWTGHTVFSTRFDTDDLIQLTLILLGETVVAVMQGMESQEDWTPAAATCAFLGMSISFVVWWWYFDGASGAAEHPVHSKRDAVRFHIWSYAHVPLYLGRRQRRHSTDRDGGIAGHAHRHRDHDSGCCNHERHDRDDSDRSHLRGSNINGLARHPETWRPCWRDVGASSDRLPPIAGRPYRDDGDPVPRTVERSARAASARSFPPL
jgi:Bacterial low temperature requirement A protein (LtrA)